MKTSASIFTGGGLFDIGAIQAGYKPIWGIELDDKIASVARLNGLPVITADVRDVDFSAMKKPTHLHASPECQRASIAYRNRGETPLDLALADSVCRAIIALQPDTFTLENVTQYRRFESFDRIYNTLADCGYFVDAQNLNSADFGVPQTRRRLWLRASRLPVLTSPRGLRR